MLNVTRILSALLLVFVMSKVMAAVHLELGHPVSTERDVDIAIEYAVPASTTSVVVLLDQIDADFELTVRSPTAEHTSNSPIFRDDFELAYLPVGHTPATVLIVTKDVLTRPARHRIVARSVTPAEIPAWRALATADRENAEGEWQAARDLYREAAHLWSILDKPSLVGRAMYSEAMVNYWWLGDWTRSSDLAQEAATYYARADAPDLVLACRQLEAISVIEMANEAPDQARAELYERATRVLADVAHQHDLADNAFGAAEALNHIGLAYYYAGDFESAREFYRSATQRYGRAGEISGIIKAQQNLAVLDTDAGNADDAIRAFQTALENLPAGKLPALRADILANLANVQKSAGQMDASLSSFTDSLDIHERLGNLSGVARALFGIGQTYSGLGEFEIANDFLRRALREADLANDSRTVTGALVYLGNASHAAGDYEQALTYHERAWARSSGRGKLLLSASVTRDLLALNRNDEAQARIESALVPAAKSDHWVQASVRRMLASTQADQGNFLEARDNFEAAARTFSRLGSVSQALETMGMLAAAALGAEDYDSAIRYADKAINTLSQISRGITDPELRRFYVAARDDVFETYITALVARHTSAHDVANLHMSLEVSEQRKARMLVDLLAEASGEIARRLPTETRTRRKQLLEELSRQRMIQTRLTQRGQLDTDIARQVRDTMARLDHQLNLIDISIRDEQTQLAALGGMVPMTAAQMQDALNADDMLLQYMIGTNNAYLWVVSKNQVTVHTLGEPWKIDGQARQTYDLLRRRSRDTELNAALRDLTQTVLPLPVPASVRRLLVVADGALHYIPFGLLRDQDGRPLFESVDIQSLPSLSAARGIRQTSTATKELAIFADPVFGANDFRVESNGDSFGPLTQALPRLAYSAVEAGWIADMLPETQSRVFLGFDASKQNALDPSLGDFRYLHFATHGVIESRFPSLSALQLATLDREGVAVDHTLRMEDIYGLNLNADLVVLSACETALGRQIRGEGLVGLSHAFFYAGARQLLVSLWQVPDVATAHLMKEFYQNLIRGHMLPRAALRQAQLTLANQSRWRKPFNWGAFVILGGNT